MPKNDNSDRSFLELVADHERKLCVEIDDAEREAKDVVNAGRAKAREILDECQRALTIEIADMETRTDEACRNERFTILDETEKRMARRRSDMARKSRVAVQSVLEMVLPGDAVVEDST